MNIVQKKVLGSALNIINKDQIAFDVDPNTVLKKDEREILNKVKRRAKRMDTGVSFCGVRFGYDAFIGMLPIAGDFITTGYALSLIGTACKANLPKSVVCRMLLNVGVDFMMGLTPVVGDILDVYFKCNTQNAKLLENVLMKRRMNEIGLETGQTFSSTSAAASMLSMLKQAKLKPDTQNEKLVYQRAY